jgi:hypothetical protein
VGGTVFLKLRKLSLGIGGSQLPTAMAKIKEVRAHHGLAALTAIGVGSGFTYDWNSMTGWYDPSLPDGNPPSVRVGGTDPPISPVEWEETGHPGVAGLSF